MGKKKKCGRKKIYLSMAKIRKMLVAGEKILSVAQSLGVHPRTIRRRIKQAKLNGRLFWIKANFKLHLKMAERFEELRNYADVGKEFHYHPDSVRRILLRVNKQMRERGEEVFETTQTRLCILCDDVEVARSVFYCPECRPMALKRMGQKAYARKLEKKMKDAR